MPRSATRVFVQVFVADDHRRALAGRERKGSDGRTYRSRSTPFRKLSELSYIAFNRNRRLVAERLIEIGGEALVAVRSALQRELVDRLEAGFLGDAIDHAASAATAEHHRVRPFQRFDAIDVVQVTVILHVVADAIDEEVGRRAVGRG